MLISVFERKEGGSQVGSDVCRFFPLELEAIAMHFLLCNII